MIVSEPIIAFQLDFGLAERVGKFNIIAGLQKREQFAMGLPKLSIIENDKDVATEREGQEGGETQDKLEIHEL